MRKAIAPEHRSYFNRHGWILFEGVLPLEDLACLTPIPKLPQLLQFVRHNQLGELAFELTGKEPLRLASFYLGTQITLQEGDCALFISLDHGQLLYTTLPSYQVDSPHFILILTPRYLDVERHPIVYRRG